MALSPLTKPHHDPLIHTWLIGRKRLSLFDLTILQSYLRKAVDCFDKPNEHPKGYKYFNKALARAWPEKCQKIKQVVYEKIYLLHGSPRTNDHAYGEHAFCKDSTIKQMQIGFSTGEQRAIAIREGISCCCSFHYEFQIYDQDTEQSRGMIGGFYPIYEWGEGAKIQKWIVCQKELTLFSMIGSLICLSTAKKYFASSALASVSATKRQHYLNEARSAWEKGVGFCTRADRKNIDWDVHGKIWKLHSVRGSLIDKHEYGKTAFSGETCLADNSAAIADLMNGILPFEFVVHDVATKQSKRIPDLDIVSLPEGVSCSGYVQTVCNAYPIFCDNGFSFSSFQKCDLWPFIYRDASDLTNDAMGIKTSIKTIELLKSEAGLMWRVSDNVARSVTLFKANENGGLLTLLAREPTEEQRISFIRNWSISFHSAERDLRIGPAYCSSALDEKTTLTWQQWAVTLVDAGPSSQESGSWSGDNGHAMLLIEGMKEGAYFSIHAHLSAASLTSRKGKIKFNWHLGEGSLKYEKEKNYLRTETFGRSSTQISQMISVIESQMSGNVDFNIFNNNCLVWAIAMLKHAGIHLPDAGRVAKPKEYIARNTHSFTLL